MNIVENLWVAWALFIGVNFAANLVAFAAFAVAGAHAKTAFGRSSEMSAKPFVGAAVTTMLVAGGTFLFNGFLLYVLVRPMDFADWGFARWALTVLVTLALIQALVRRK